MHWHVRGIRLMQWSWWNTISRYSREIPRLVNQSLFPREMRWTSLPFRTTAMTLPCCWGRFIICIPRRISGQAIREALRVTKPGGILFAAYVISDGCLLDEGFHRGNIDVAEYVRTGLLDGETFAAKSEPKDLFELVRKEDIDALMSGFPVKRLHYVASDGCARLLREAIDAMDDETFHLYLKYHFVTCEREDLVGVTSHALDISRKL